MLYGRYDFHLIFEEEAFLPLFKGLAIRRSLEAAFRQVVCVLRQQTCASCPLLSTCLFAKVFETGAVLSDRKPVRPMFALAPSDMHQTLYSTGSGLAFGLMLFGELTQELPYFVYAVDRAGRSGLGRRLRGRRPRFRIEAVSAQGGVIYQGEAKTLACPGVEELCLSEPQAETPELLNVKLVSPLRIVQEGLSQRSLPFEVLAFAAIRRVRQLTGESSTRCQREDLRCLREKAQQVKLRQARLQWEDCSYFSTRQNKRIHLGGLAGEVTYEGPVGDFLPFLKFVEKTNVGKSTAFGLGSIRVNAG